MDTNPDEIVGSNCSILYLLDTVKKEMKGSGNFEILQEIVPDTTRISSSFSDFRVH